ncbi:MAG TPA: HAD hydrolase-like protein [Rickettsiales bacterium]|nr:HAD hydrolase-like protein [Rickettsiales bacterium]
MKKDLLFDLDDTLVSLNESKDLAIIETLNFYLDKIFSIKDINAYKSFFKEKNIFILIELILKEFKTITSIDFIKDNFLKFYVKIGFEREKMLINTSLLKDLKTKYDLNIITNRPRIFFDIIWKDRLNKYFKNVVCVDDFVNIPKKPNSLIITNAIEKLKLNAEFYIGNEENDLIASKNAGLKCVLINSNKNLNADFILNDINEISNLFL